jgi:hypothetical protein
MSAYERLSKGRIQVELAANIILGAVGESAIGFAQRPVLRKWITRWLWLLWRSKLTLADAGMLIDPQNPVYDLLIQLAPYEMARHQMESLPGMRAAELEAEIGSARNRIANVLEHPAAEVLLSRRKNTIDFRKLYDDETSVIVDLDRAGILSEEVQRLICNIVLNQYLAVVLSTPEPLRRRRLCMIDELPVFNESCGPLLERMCTEIRKYKTSFMFLHQGGARFPGRTENEFLLTILDMCRVKVFFRHNVDAEFFGKLVALSAHGKPRIKHVQTSIQQLTVGQEIVQLIDHGEGTSDMTGQTTTEGTTDTQGDSSAVSNALSQAVKNVDSRTKTDGTTKTSNNSSAVSKAKATQQTTTRTTNKTVKQTLVPILRTDEVVSSLQFFTKEEIEWAAGAVIKELKTGEAVVMVDGMGIWQTQTPEAKEPFGHAPKFAAQKLADWWAKIVKRPEFASPTAIQDERKEFLACLLKELRKLSSQQSWDRIADGNPPGYDRRIQLDPDDEDKDDPDPNVAL